MKQLSQLDLVPGHERHPCAEQVCDFIINKTPTALNKTVFNTSSPTILYLSSQHYVVSDRTHTRLKIPSVANWPEYLTLYGQESTIRTTNTIHSNIHV